jgi:hypothetical protein
MKNSNFMTGLTKTFNTIGFQLKKHSPEILVVAGVAGTVVSAVMACKATTKVSQVKEEHNKQIETIHTSVETGKTPAGEDYTEEDSKKDLTLVYVQTGLKYVKLYGPSVILGSLSIASIFASNNIMRKRNVALAAAYATVDKGFKAYRNNVIERFGEEVDRQLKYNIKATEIEETVVDENGEEKTVKKTVDVVNPEWGSVYARFFDEASPYWEKDSEYNLMFLHTQQNYANDLLKAKGRVFLNEVYSMLGIPPSKAGQVVGWVYDPTGEMSDNYIDFGIYDGYRSSSRDFVNGYERVILLDFNVDGNVWEDM